MVFGPWSFNPKQFFNFYVIPLCPQINPNPKIVLMRTILFSFIAAALILSSCKKDEFCDPGNLDTNIVGTWKVSVIGIPAGKIEFQANGDLVTDPNILTDAYFGSDTLGQKTYVVNADSSVTVTATNNNVVQTSILTVNDYSCDEINVETTGGVAMKFKRKN